MSKALLICLFSVPLITGCTIHRPGLIAQANIGPKEIPVRVAQGKSRAFYVLFFGPFGDNSLAAAVEDAKRNASADTMLNVFADKEIFTFLLLYTRSTTKVYGTLVNYDPPITKQDSSRIEQVPPNATAGPASFEASITGVPKGIKEGDPIRLTLTSGTVVTVIYELGATGGIWFKTQDNKRGSIPFKKIHSIEKSQDPISNWGAM